MQTEKKIIHVAVAVIRDTAGRFLISCRLEHVHGGGCWEFPGGKLEPGETVSHALCREINEELGVTVLEHRPLIQITHRYSDRSVLLDVHRITRFEGIAEGLEGQQLAWVALENMAQYALLPADRPIVTALSLPDCYLITGPDASDRKTFLSRLEFALDAGIGLVQLRAKSLSDIEFQSLAKIVLKLCRRYDVRCLLNASPGLVRDLGADGVHLTGQQLQILSCRPLSTEYLVAASCHSASDLAKATELGLDFAVLSPVLATDSHPQAQPLGWDQFSALVKDAGLPVYALGGMHTDMTIKAQSHGAQGIAGISGLWGQLKNTAD